MPLIFSFAGSTIEQYWEQLDEAGNHVKRFVDNELIEINYEELSTLAFKINVTEPMAYFADFYITSSESPVIVTEYFQRKDEFDKGTTSDTGKYLSVRIILAPTVPGWTSHFHRAFEFDAWGIFVNQKQFIDMTKYLSIYWF